jgi:hypothetical protein
MQNNGRQNSERLGKKLLCTDQSVPDHDSVRAFNDARGTIAATQVTGFPGQFHETQPRLLQASAKIIVSQKTQLVRYRHAFGALVFALVTHAAVEGAILFFSHKQKLFVGWSVRSRHSTDIHLEFMDALMMRNCCANRMIPQNPLECRNTGFLPGFQRRLIGKIPWRSGKTVSL